MRITQQSFHPDTKDLILYFDTSTLPWLIKGQYKPFRWDLEVEPAQRRRSELWNFGEYGIYKIVDTNPFTLEKQP